MRDPRDIIKKPLVTEKTNDLMAENKYTFEVDKNANKIEIKNAIQKLFDVKVQSVNTMNMKGKIQKNGCSFWL